MTTIFSEDFQEFLKQTLTETIKEALYGADVPVKQKQEQAKEKKYYTIAEVCDLLHITKPTFHSNVKKGIIKPIKIGRRTLVDANLLDAMIADGQVSRYQHFRARG